MTEVASAYVTLLPDTRGFGKSTEAQVTPEIKSAGSRVGSFFGGALKKGAFGVTLAAGGLLATALTKGFTRLEAIDNATAKLTGLGHSAKSVDLIMKNALASVKGTAFGLGDAATVAASTVAAGIRPGRELTKTLKLVADAATISGTSMSDMGAIFNKVAASNKIQGDVIAQLNDQGIPIVQLLGKQLGVTASQVTELASKGKIDFATFQKAMQAGLGGAALKSGNTFSGALANVGASLSRIGAGLLGGIFPHLAPMFQGITKALEPLEGKAKTLGDAIGKALGPSLEQVGPFLSRITTALANMDFGKLKSGQGTLGGIGDSLKKLGAAFKGVDFGALAKGLGQGASDTISVFAVVVKVAADHTDLLAKALPALVVAFAAYKTAQAGANVLALAHVPLTTAQVVANVALARSNTSLAAQMALSNGVEQVGLVTRARNTVATIASTAASIAAGAATKVFAAGQWLLNAALAANPIGLVIVAIAALVAGIILAYKHSETFRNVVNAVFSFLKTAVAAAIGFIGNHWKLIVTLIVGPIALVAIQVVKHWSAIKAATQKVWSAIKAAVSTYINAVKTIVGTAVKAVIAYFNTWAAIVGKVRGWFEAIVSAIRSKLSEAVNSVKSIPGKIAAALSTLKEIGLHAGAELISGLVTGILSKLSSAVAAAQRIASSIKDHFPGSPVKKGPLKSWNRGQTGKKLIQMLADGIIAGSPKAIAAATHAATGIQKAVLDRLNSIRDGAKSTLDGLKSDFASLRGSIAQAFTGDLFSATDVGAFNGNLSVTKATLTRLKAALTKLTGWGVNPGFLSQLFASGNTNLILQLAGGSKANALNDARLFGQVNSLSQQLGTAVARDQYGAKLDRQTAVLERIDRGISRLPKDFGHEVNKGAKSGHRKGGKR